MRSLAEHGWYAIAIVVGLAAPVAIGIYILLLTRRRMGGGTAQPPNAKSHVGKFEGIAAVLILLVGLPILWIGSRSLVGEVGTFWKSERKSIQITDVFAEHTKSFHETGVSYSLLVVLTGKVDGVPRELQTRLSGSGSLLGAKSQFEALRGKQLAIWTSPGSSHFRLRKEFRWDGIAVGFIGLSFVAVSIGALIHAWRDRLQSRVT